MARLQYMLTPLQIRNASSDTSMHTNVLRVYCCAFVMLGFGDNRHTLRLCDFSRLELLRTQTMQVTCILLRQEKLEQRNAQAFIRFCSIKAPFPISCKACPALAQLCCVMSCIRLYSVMTSLHLQNRIAELLSCEGLCPYRSMK